MSIPATGLPWSEVRGALWFACLTLCALALVLSSAHARDAIERSPYGPVVVDVFERLYVSDVPCELALDPDTRCFVIAPGTVAGVAEALESIVLEYGGALARSEWRSANGVHHVALSLSDDLWGVLELWFTEIDGQAVHGRVLFVARARNGSP